MSPLPAYDTKHLKSLIYSLRGHSFVLAQSDDGHSNGTALWLGGQILSQYLVQHLKLPSPGQTRPRAVELGSGVGLTALVLGALGYDVLATDTRHVCNAVLRHNIAANLPNLPASAGFIQVRELDWNVACETWQWNDTVCITPTGDAFDSSSTSGDCGANSEPQGDLLGPPFDLIISSDTLYDIALVQPFFLTVQALVASSRKIEPLKSPLFLLALERRDPHLIEHALACAPVPLTRVPTKKVRKSLERAGIRWNMSDWQDVEIWKGSL